LRAFKQENNLAAPNEDFDCEEFRYNHRFNPFQFFQIPQLCLYHQFRDGDAKFVKSFDVAKLYAYAQENFEMARAMFEKYPECVPVSFGGLEILKKEEIF
jgi:hypothetical protein